MTMIYLLYYMDDIEDFGEVNRTDLFFSQIDRPFIFSSEEIARDVVKVFYKMDLESALEMAGEDETASFDPADAEPTFVNTFEEVEHSHRYVELFDDELKKSVIWYSPGVLQGLRFLVAHDVDEDANNILKEHES